MQNEPSEHNSYYVDHLAIIVASYAQLLVKPMPLCGGAGMPLDVSLAHDLYNAPFALISHNTEVEPVFNYANKTAMQLFNMSWHEITSMKSKYSAEQPDRMQRAVLLERVKVHGYIENYAGVRIARGGHRFQIKDATVWNLTDFKGRYYGQAAMFGEPGL